jgi:predicted nucleic acid-binding protein
MKSCFIDSNIVVYANDARETAKQNQAIGVITACMKGKNGVVSIQVLQEYANIALKKLQQASPIVLRQLKLLETLRVITPSPKAVRRSVEISESYKVSFWDAGIIAAAEEGECEAIFSADFNPGQYYAGIEVVDPLSPGFDLARYAAV